MGGGRSGVEGELDMFPPEPLYLTFALLSSPRSLPSARSWTDDDRKVNSEHGGPAITTPPARSIRQYNSKMKKPFLDVIS